MEGRGDFGSDDLERALQKTLMPSTHAEPTKYYPFSHEEKTSVIVPYVLTGIAACVLARAGGLRFDPRDDASVSEILERTHGYYGLVSAADKRKLARKAKEILAQVRGAYADFADHLDKMKSGTFVSGDFEKFNDICRRISMDYKGQTRLTDIVFEEGIP